MEQNKPFTFIACKGLKDGINDRGGLLYSIIAFKKEFKKMENVKFLIKVNASYAPTQVIESQIKESIKVIDGANINIIYQSLVEKDMNFFYNEGDVFVSTSRCEGFNLPILEAMSCRVPCITTNFGGQMDFCDDKNSLFIPVKLEEVTHDITHEGNFWGTPNIEDIRKTMRYAFENQDVIKKMGLEAEKTAAKFTWAKAVEVAEKAMKELK